MSELIEEICRVVEAAILDVSKATELSAPVTADSAMNSPREWDSLAFVNVFIAVSEHFELEVEEDDAIHFMSVAAMAEFIEDVRD